MFRRVRLTESQFNAVLQYKILNEARQGDYRPHWSAEDQILALYSETFGLTDVWPGSFRSESQRRENFTNNVLGTTGASLLKNGLNFRWLRTKNTSHPEGLPRETDLQNDVFDKYGSWNRQQLKELVLNIIDEKIKNPDEWVLAYRKVLGQKNLDDAKARARAAQKALHDIDPERYPYKEEPPKRRYNIRKSETVPELPFEPEVPETKIPEPEVPETKIPEPEVPETKIPEPEVVKTNDTEKEKVRNYLKSIYDRMQSAKTLKDVKSLSSEIQFIMDYIDMELTDKEQKMVAEMKEFIKNQNVLSEAIVDKNIKRIKKIMSTP